MVNVATCNSGELDARLEKNAPAKEVESFVKAGAA